MMDLSFLTDEDFWGHVFVGAIFLLIASVVVWCLRYEIRVRRWFTKLPLNSAHAKGEITAITSPEFNELVLDYRFRAHDGSEHTSAIRLSRLMLNRLQGKEYQVGDLVEITYHPGNPDLSYIEPHRMEFFGAATGMSGFLVICVLFFWWFFS